MTGASATGRLLRAPFLILGLWLGQLLIAMLGAGFVGAVAKRAMRGFAWLDDGHRLAALAELLGDNTPILGAFISSFTFALTVGALFWLFAAGAVFERLGLRSRGRDTLAAAGRWAPAMLALTAYSLVLRALLVGLGYALSLAWPPLAFMMPVGYVLALLAFDEARARAVLEGARWGIPRTSFGALIAVLRRPGLVAGGVVLVALSWALLAFGVAWATAQTSGAASILVVRGLALVSLCLGLLRISWVIGERASVAAPIEG